MNGASMRNGYRLLYVVLEDSSQLNSCSNVTGCVCRYVHGIAVIFCEADDDLANVILSLIETGVDPKAVASWVCGPAGELARLYLVRPNPCPTERTGRLVVRCAGYKPCANAYSRLRRAGFGIRVSRINRIDSLCYQMSLVFENEYFLAHIVAAAISLDDAPSLTIAYPRRLPPLPIPSGGTAWLVSCVKRLTRFARRDSTARI